MLESTKTEGIYGSSLTQEEKNLAFEELSLYWEEAITEINKNEETIFYQDYYKEALRGIYSGKPKTICSRKDVAEKLLNLWRKTKNLKSERMLENVLKGGHFDTEADWCVFLVAEDLLNTQEGR